MKLTFRGYLCQACNHGLGQLGDCEEGLVKALAYLKKANAGDATSKVEETQPRTRKPRSRGTLEKFAKSRPKRDEGTSSRSSRE